MSLGTALKAFWTALVDPDKSAQIQAVLDGQIALAQPPRPAETKPQAPAKPPRPTRDSALTLLATLQREARLVDLVQEDLAQFSDAQVGAAARPCLQQCAQTMSRLFSLTPLVEAGEGESIDVSSDASPLRFQWVGEGTSNAGKLIHHGWQAGKVELPVWNGAAEDALVIAPAQIQSP